MVRLRSYLSFQPKAGEQRAVSEDTAVWQTLQAEAFPGLVPPCLLPARRGRCTVARVEPVSRKERDDG